MTRQLTEPMGLGEQARRFARGDISSVELVTDALERAAATQPQLNAFCRLREDAALAEAADADRRRAAGERALLLGVPVAIKDDCDLAGEPTAFGTAAGLPVPNADCALARRLRDAGAIVIGKTTTPEFGQWPITESAAFGVTRNPWCLDRTPGGSSGGSAAAVAAGVVAAATGSDGAGSIRIPAAWTNLVGLKPQRGRVPTSPEIDPFNGLTCHGPLARTVGDAALLLDAIADDAPAMSYSAAAALDPGPLRIALSFRIPFSGTRCQLDPAVRTCVEHVATTLCDLGHDVVGADPAYGPIGVTFLPRSLGGVRDWARRVDDPARLDPRTRHNARVGRLLGGPALRAARACERPLRARVGRIFRDVDVVLTPTTAQPPLPIGAIDGLGAWDTDEVIVRACPYAWPWNVLGWPALNIPAGLTADGLPVGAQLLGPADSEPLLLALATQLEGVERWHERAPASLQDAA